MTWGLLGALGAAVCYGAATILQALAARAETSAEGLDPRLLLRLARSWRYLLGLALDGFAFLLSIAALQSMPLFAVQAVVASFLAITAVLGAVFLDMPLTPRDRVALVVVIGGLVLVGLSAAEDRAVAVRSAQRWGVLVAAVLLALVAVPLGRLGGAMGAAALGTVAGLGFGVVAVAARTLPRFGGSTLRADLTALLTDPGTYALVMGAIVALLSYSIALQRGSVTQATAPLVVGETVAPALVGILMLGDAPRPGWGWVAVGGFVLAVGGAVALSGHGEVEAMSAATRGTPGPPGALPPDGPVRG